MRGLLAALALAAIGRQLTLHLGAAYSAVNFFSYFTNLSNLFAAAVLLITAFGWPRHAVALEVARFVSAVNMAVVGIVFAALLRDVELGALLPWVNFVLHYVMPVVVVMDWLWNPPTFRLNVRHIGLALVFPFAYLAYVMLRGVALGWYPYPFLDPANAGGAAGVAAYSVGIAATFLLGGWALLALGNRGKTVVQ